MLNKERAPQIDKGLISCPERLERARVSLEGLSVGDSFGRFYEFGDLIGYISVTPEFIKSRTLASDSIWRWSDDTSMALSIFENLRLYGEVVQDELAKDFALRLDGNRGYGSSTWDILTAVQKGASWQEYSRQAFGYQGSFGNGAAMRVAPIGAYYADDLNKVVVEATKSAVITHSHPEGISGAIAVAIAVSIALQQKHLEKRPTRKEFIDLILPFVPEGVVKQGIVVARELNDVTAVQAALILGSGEKVSAQDTVPFVLWCAGEYIDNFEEAMWQTVSGLQDTDTTCAMVGAIVASYTGVKGIPVSWLQKREAIQN